MEKVWKISLLIFSFNLIKFSNELNIDKEKSVPVNFPAISDIFENTNRLGNTSTWPPDLEDTAP